jgi:hypothetical protein
MPILATVLPFTPHLIAAPRCAQCETKMGLQRVEPHPTTPYKAMSTYACLTCGLLDRTEELPRSASASNEEEAGEYARRSP